MTPTEGGTALREADTSTTYENLEIDVNINVPSARQSGTRAASPTSGGGESAAGEPGLAALGEGGDVLAEIW
jgi:hypothetical protein